MIIDVVDAHLPQMRAHAESLMLDTVRIERPGETVTDPDSGEVTNSTTTVYLGRGRWKPPATVATTDEVGTAIKVTTPGEVHIPVGSYDPTPGDIIECVGSVRDPILAGSRATVRSRFGGSPTLHGIA